MPLTRSRLAIALAGALLAACGSPAVPTTTQRGATAGRGTPDGATPAPPTRAARASVSATPFDYIPVDGCARAERDRIDATLKELAARVDALKPVDEIDAIVETLRTVWRHPCLVTVNRFGPPPRPRTVAALRDVFDRGLSESLLAANGGLPLRDGKRVLVIPPQVVPDADPLALAALASLVCNDHDATCARAKSYVKRAEDSFDGAEAMESLDLTRDDCKSDTPENGTTAFETWAVCRIRQVPGKLRYPDLALRAPTSGWLALRGRRGHYTFADEVRAYDLASGAAYVASSASELVLDGPSVDVAETNRQRAGSTQRGDVATDQAREIAFLLLTKDLPVRYRDRITSFDVPDDVDLTFTADARSPLATERFDWRSSAQTRLTFALMDDKRTLAQGTFLWPGSSNWAEDHAASLVRAMEAGLVAGCPAPRPPPFLGRGNGAVSAIDAPAANQRDVFTDLDAAMQAFARSPCKRR